MPTGIPTKITLNPNNDEVLELDGLSDIITGFFQDTATVSATLYDQTGAPVPGATNISMAYIPGTNGNYRGIITSGSFSPNPPGNLGNTISGYKLVITAIVGAVQMVLTIKADIAPRAQ